MDISFPQFINFYSCSVIKAKRAKKYALMEPSVAFYWSSESTSINMSSIYKKSGLGIPNPTAIENDNEKEPDFLDEGTSI